MRSLSDYNSLSWKKKKRDDTCFLQNKLRPKTHSIIRGYSLIVIQNLGSACGGKKYVTLKFDV